MESGEAVEAVQPGWAAHFAAGNLLFDVHTRSFAPSMLLSRHAGERTVRLAKAWGAVSVSVSISFVHEGPGASIELIGMPDSTEIRRIDDDCVVDEEAAALRR